MNTVSMPSAGVPQQDIRTRFLWENIPAEMQALKQWVLASSMTIIPYYVTDIGSHAPASVINPATWMTFQAACHHAAICGMCVGFVITEDDPYACVDVDDKLTHRAPEGSLEWYWQLAVQLDSYTELSPSRRGLHTWIKADLAAAMKRHPFEVYSQRRYIRCTGWAMIHSPIRKGQQFAEWFVATCGAIGHKGTDFELVELPEKHTDDLILTRASTADNGRKFIDLFEGRWEQYRFPSQSEADQSLITMLAFYSDSNEQCRRLFRLSVLGQRKKTRRNNYHVNLALKYARKRRADQLDKIASVDISGLLRGCTHRSQS